MEIEWTLTIIQWRWKLKKARMKRKDCREKRWRGVWDEEGCRRFREKVSEIRQRGGELAVGEEWERMKEKVRKAVREIEQKLRRGSWRSRGWWNEECRMMKGEVRRKLRRWRRSGEGEKKYKERRGNYKMCERKKREKNERWKSKAEEARRESELWEIINRERKRGRGINENMRMEEWKDYFRGLLGG